MSVLDIAVIGFVGLSALFAFLRGFTREMLAIAAWIGAAFLTYRFFPALRPFVAAHISPPWVADLTAGVGLFVVALVVFSILSHFVSERVRGSSVGPLDRTLGLLFGIARGVLVVCLLYGVADRFMLRESQPEWVKSARVTPLLQKGADYLVALMPQDKMVPHGPRPHPQAPPPQKVEVPSPDSALGQTVASAIVSSVSGVLRGYRSVFNSAEDKR